MQRSAYHKALFFLSCFMKESPKLTMIWVVVCCVQGVGVVSVPYTLKCYLDHVTIHGQLVSYGCLLGLMGLFWVRLLCDAVIQYCQHDLLCGVKKRLFGHALSPWLSDANPTLSCDVAKTTHHIQDMMIKLEMFIGHASSYLSSFSSMLCILFLLSDIHGYYTVLILFFIALCFGLYQKQSLHRCHLVAMKNESYQHFMQILFDHLVNIKSILLWAQQHDEHDRSSKAFAHACHDEKKWHDFTRSALLTREYLWLMIVLMILWFTYGRYLRHEIHASHVMMAVMLIMTLGQILRYIFSHLDQLSLSLQGDDVLPCYHQQALENSYALPENVKLVQHGSIILDGVSLCWPGNKTILSNQSLCVAAGDHIMLQGASGCGKSSLIGLLLAWYAPTKGRILIDKHDIAYLSPNHVRQQIGHVPQHFSYLHRSIRENILYGIVPDLHHRMEEAAEFTECHEWIKSLPQGYHTRLGPDGVTLSGGQYQRIALARLALMRRPLMILDEATNALDVETEQSILTRLLRQWQGCTVIIVSHRSVNRSLVDYVLHIDQGHIQRRMV